MVLTYYAVQHLSDWQKQVINGTIMGGSSLVRTASNKYYLSMRGKNGRWLQCKANEMNLPLPPNPYFLEKNYFRWHSSSLPIFGEFYQRFYKDGKKFVDMEVLNGFRAVGLSVWFLDAGVIKDGVIHLNVKSFGQEGAKIINKYFYEIDLDTKIVGTKIWFGEKSTERFINVIGDYIPQFILDQGRF